jgi:HD-GYP domain-containing protein (c-di-GMP phosphodiesterase class II)
MTEGGAMGTGAAPGFRLSEVMSALSYALDLTEGQPEGHSVRTCLIGMRIADETGVTGEARADLFYTLLMKDAGCSVNAAPTTTLFGADDDAVKRSWKAVDWTRRGPGLRHVLRSVRPGEPLSARLRQAWGIVTSRRSLTADLVRARCDRGADIARMLGLSEETAAGIRSLDEHWDGGGVPMGLRGEQIPLLARIACLAQTVEIFHAAHGLPAALAVARERAGRWFDPRLVAALLRTRRDGEFWNSLREDAAARAAALHPAGLALAADDQGLDRIAEAFARVIDAKSPYTYRHSEGVAAYAVAAGRMMGFSPAALRDLRRAGLLHDLGKLGVSNRILDKPGKLTEEEFAAVRRHPELTHRILVRVEPFRELAEVAASHHERMDGRGYHRGLPAGTLPPAARVLAAADVCDALSAERPYRAALPRERVLSMLREQRGPALCPDAVDALEAALLADPGLGMHTDGMSGSGVVAA